MPLQDEAKKLYQREYMRRRRAGLPTRAPPKPKGKCCSLCSRPPSRERIVIVSERGVRICETCVAEVAELIAEIKKNARCSVSGRADGISADLLAISTAT
jgi:ClpX C4-type zinc finger